MTDIIEPATPGLYATVTADFDVACGRRMIDWDTVVGSLDDSEFPLKRIDEKDEES